MARSAGSRLDYSKWDSLAQEQLEEEEAENERNDPMTWPVCSEIPWHNMEPVVDKILDEEYGYGQYKKQKAQTQPSSTAETSKRQTSTRPGPVENVRPARQTPASDSFGVASSSVPPQARASHESEQSLEKDAQSALDAADLTTNQARAQSLAHKSAGSAAFAKRDFNGAIRAWRRAEELARKANDHDLWIAARANVSLVEFKLQNWSAVEQLTTELLGAAPKHEKSLYRRGVARERLGNFEGAQQDFMRALSLNFMNMEAQDALNRVQQQLSQPR